MYSFTELARSAQCAFDRLRATEVCTSLRRAGMLLCSAVPDCTKIPKCSALPKESLGPAVGFDPCMQFPGARCERSLRFPCPVSLPVPRHRRLRPASPPHPLRWDLEPAGGLSDKLG